MEALALQIWQHVSCGTWRKSGGLEEQGLGSEGEVDREYLMCSILWRDNLWTLTDSRTGIQRIMGRAEHRSSPGRRWNRSKNHCGGQAHRPKKHKGPMVLEGAGKFCVELWVIY